MSCKTHVYLIRITPSKCFSVLVSCVSCKTYIDLIRILPSKCFYSLAGASQWKNYTREEHLYNVRAFARYMKVDRKVIEASSSFHDLPADSGKRSRTRQPATVFSTTSDDCPSKKNRFLFDLVSSDEDEPHDKGGGDEGGDDKGGDGKGGDDVSGDDEGGDDEGGDDEGADDEGADDEGGNKEGGDDEGGDEEGGDEEGGDKEGGDDEK